MLHSQTRKLLLKALEKGTEVTDIAKAYCVNRSTGCSGGFRCEGFVFAAIQPGHESD